MRCSSTRLQRFDCGCKLAALSTSHCTAEDSVRLRLNSKRTLSSAVQWLVLNAASLQPQSNLCKRVLEQRISARTGGYCQARQKLPTLVVTSVTDHLFEQLQAQMREELPDVP